MLSASLIPFSARIRKTEGNKVREDVGRTWPCGRVGGAASVGVADFDGVEGSGTDCWGCDSELDDDVDGSAERSFGISRLEISSPSSARRAMGAPIAIPLEPSGIYGSLHRCFKLRFATADGILHSPKSWQGYRHPVHQAQGKLCPSPTSFQYQEWLSLTSAE